MNPESCRHTMDLRDGWKFQLGDCPDGADPGIDDTAWEPVRVPHDWAIRGPFDRANDIHRTAILEDGETREKEHTGRTGGLPHVGRAWYRLPVELPSALGNRRVRIEFDGVMSHSRIYWNGQETGGWPFGYASFAVDVTAQARPGINLLAVAVDNPPLASRWYPGAGIYRHVRLVILNTVHIAHWGIAVTTPEINAEDATVAIRTAIENHLDTPGDIALETTIFDPDGQAVATATKACTLKDAGSCEQTFTLDKPRLWSTQTPRLYTARTRLSLGGRTVDQQDTTFGVRSIRFDVDAGFELNGNRVQLNGVCMHHDLGPLGAAVNRAALARQLRILKEMGCNAIRTSHNPPAPELLDLTDRMGFLVMDEAFDEWRLGKCENGYHRLFEQWAEKDLRAMIRRDRNHPSVIMWSIGNEIREQTDAENGAAIARFLCDICHDEDPTRPTTAGLNSPEGALKNGIAAIVDVPGWNYRPNDYAHYHRLLPDRAMVASETASCISSRGEYFFPVDDDTNPCHASLQVSSYDLSTTGWSSSPDVEFQGVDNHPYVIGEFVWTGFDYLGEPTPYNEQWPSRSSYFGIVDLAGIPKDRYYLYQSRWADRQTLHLLPHWTWPGREGEVTPVHCYSSWDRVELFVNGISQGIRCKRPKNLMNRYRLVWSGIRYTPGELKAVAYDDAGNVAKTTVVRTAQAAAVIALESDRKEIAADGDDMAFLRVRILDAHGNPCPRADHHVRFRIEGPANIAGVCNGDATSLEPFQADTCRLFNGQCVLYLRSRRQQSGTVTVYAEADHLATAMVTIKC